MLDHVSINVPKDRLEEVTNWYLAALAPLGYQKWKDFPGLAVGLGPEKYSIPFWIGVKPEGEVGSTHIAFRCSDRSKVDKFYEEGIKAGGKCNGAPGLRHMYHPKYYAAFVLDPVGLTAINVAGKNGHAESGYGALDDRKVKTSDRALGDRLSALLHSAREANKLSEERIPVDPARQSSVRGGPEQNNKTPSPQLTEGMHVVRGDNNSPSRRLNPIATPYVPPNINIFDPSNTFESKKHFQEAYDDGMARGYASALQEGNKKGLQQGRLIGISEAKTQGKAEGQQGMGYSRSAGI